jgi:UDP-galactopyranose mutase
MNHANKTGSARKSPSNTSIVAFPFERMEETFDSGRDLICFSHLRWNFVFQRPQHLMTRFARERRVFFVEEPVVGSHEPGLSMSVDNSGVCIVVPHLPDNCSPDVRNSSLNRLLHEMFDECRIRNAITWYYTPMALAFSRDLPCAVVVYDCMDELSLFRGAPRELTDYEAELMRRTDVVFTGGFSLYEAKSSRHPNVHSMPSSIDVDHFAQARGLMNEPEDQAKITGTKLGFAGVIDERMDIDLLGRVASSHPEWQFIMLGPVVKIDPSVLPRAENIHYLGQKRYQDLPAYISSWDVALMPFARNEATRFISPTKTPEYLASGKPVVSTAIRDVMHTYKDLVKIADTPDEFARAIAASLEERSDTQRFRSWQARADLVLAKTSWDRTWTEMMTLIESAIAARESAHANAS